jgi:uncharacterized membrane-anchored protein
MEQHEKTISGWQDAIELAVVAWVFVAPVVLGYFGNNAATLVAMGTAAVASLSTQLGIAKQSPWAEWFNLAFALFLALSPWLFSYSAIQLATLNAVLAGLVLALFAIWAMTSEYMQIQRYRHGPTH